MPRARSLVAAVSISLALLSTACVPSATTGTPQAIGRAAVREFFAGGIYWPKADCIAERESHYTPGANNGKYLGIFQIDSTNSAYITKMHAAADNLDEQATFTNARVNALVAYYIMRDRRLAGLDPYGPWTTAGGC